MTGKYEQYFQQICPVCGKSEHTGYICRACGAQTDQPMNWDRVTDGESLFEVEIIPAPKYSFEIEQEDGTIKHFSMNPYAVRNINKKEVAAFDVQKYALISTDSPETRKALAIMWLQDLTKQRIKSAIFFHKNPDVLKKEVGEDDNKEDADGKPRVVVKAMKLELPARGSTTTVVALQDLPGGIAKRCYGVCIREYRYDELHLVDVIFDDFEEPIYALHVSTEVRFTTIWDDMISQAIQDSVDISDFIPDIPKFYRDFWF
jgi:hypothetical protein